MIAGVFRALISLLALDCPIKFRNLTGFSFPYLCAHQPLKNITAKFNMVKVVRSGAPEASSKQTRGE